MTATAIEIAGLQGGRVSLLGSGSTSSNSWSRARCCVRATRAGTTPY